MYKSIDFLKSWKEWKQHKEEKSGLPLTTIAESKALSRLYKLSHGIEELAIISIEYSIENNWSNIYIKKPENGEQTNETKSEFRSKVQSEFDKRYGQVR
jgi:hypothetical protein